MRRLCLFTIFAFLCFLKTEAQVAKQRYDSLLISRYSMDLLNAVDVYSKSQLLNQNDTIVLFDNRRMSIPYDSCWMYFADKNPFANWHHPCEYVFVDKVTGNMVVVEESIYPKTFYTEHSGFDTLFFLERPEVIGFPEYTSDIAVVPAEPADNLYAVLICGPSDTIRHNNDMSLIYCMLIEKYGYKEENIYVHYKGGPSINNVELDGDGVLDDVDYSANKESILATFSEMAGETNLNPAIPKLTSSDQLFIYVTGHGFYDNGGYNYDITFYISLQENSNSYQDYCISDADFANSLQNIDCAQICVLMEQCYSGGFARRFLDFENYNVVCENRFFQSATNESNPSYSECYITNDKYDEFTFYWAAAARGYYPKINEPWTPSFPVGEFPFENYSFRPRMWREQCYPPEPPLPPHPDDRNPDLNMDGFIQMSEAFAYANDYDSWSDCGYYNPYFGQPTIEVPLSFEDRGFQEDLVTLSGLCGFLYEDEMPLSRSYLFGDVTLTYNSVLNVIPQTRLSFLHNSMGKLTTERNTSLLLNHDVVLSGNGNNLLVKGNVRASYVTFNDVIVKLIGIGDTDVPFISNCIIDNTNSPLGMEIRSCQNFRISSNQITSKGDGIKVYYSGFGQAGNQKIVGNKIYNCQGSGIIIYNSTTDLRMNNVYGNSIGIKSLNSSNITSMKGNPSALTLSETQRIHDNDKFEMYITLNSIPQYLNYNGIYRDNSSIIDTLIFYDGSIAYNQWSRNTQFDVTSNYWGCGVQPTSQLVGPSNIEYLVAPVWIPNGGIGIVPPPVDMMDNGLSLFESGYYAEAKAVFQNVVRNYPRTISAQTAMKELFRVELFTTNDYETLRTYYLTNDSIVADSTLAYLGKKLSNKCNIALGLYDTAAQWYENAITYPVSYADSIFAVIDLEYLNNYIRQEDKQLSLKKMEQYEKHRDELVSLLPKIENPYQCNKNLEYFDMEKGFVKVYPNPCSEKFTIQLPENETISNITLYDTLGAIILTTKESEVYTEELPKGLMILIIETNSNNVYRQTIINE